jgi:hypothetical protein
MAQPARASVASGRVPGSACRSQSAARRAAVDGAILPGVSD